jgi:glycyl-tRNA synthetase alpha chain
MLDKKLSLPAYDQCLKASHIFNLLDARGVIGVAERTGYIARIRELAKGCGALWLNSQN